MRNELADFCTIHTDSEITVIVAPVPDTNLIAWTKNHCNALFSHLKRRGAILFRGFACYEELTAENLLQVFSKNGMPYYYQSTPRKLVSGKTYTSTEYPSTETIHLHSEMAYAQDWPMLVAFHSIRVAEKGGETPIADLIKITESIPPCLLKEFHERGLMYVRNYSADTDLPWQKVFGTREPKIVDGKCHKANIQAQWLGEDRLRTRQVCQGTAMHPWSKRLVFFNQAHLFHISSFDEHVREYLESTLPVDGLPRNVYWGDGEVIQDSIIEEISTAFNSKKHCFSWKPEDVLLLDNMRFCHGRSAFSGDRKVLVSMAEPYSLAALNISST